LSEIFLILRRTEGDIINVHRSTCKVPVILVIFRWNLCSPRIFKKYSNTKCHENPSSRNRVFTCGRTDRQKYMTKLIVAECNFLNAPKKRQPLCMYWSSCLRNQELVTSFAIDKSMGISCTLDVSFKLVLLWLAVLTALITSSPTVLLCILLSVLLYTF
jgi:hypothetical protein